MEGDSAISEPVDCKSASTDTIKDLAENSQEGTTVDSLVRNILEEGSEAGEKLESVIVADISTAEAPSIATTAAEEPTNMAHDCAEYAKTNTVIIQSNVVLTPVERATTPTPDSKEIAMATKTPAAATGLAMLAQYDSDDNEDAEDARSVDNLESSKESDCDSVVEAPVTGNKNYRNRVVEIDSDTETCSTVSDSSDSDNEVEYLNEIRKAIDRSLADDDNDDDEENSGSGSANKSHKRQPPRVKGELLLDDLPPIQDLHITVPEEECIELGRVHSIVEQLVLVTVLPNSMLLDLETVLFLEKGKRVLGEVFDVLGQVADPLYCVRFNSNKQIHERGITVGDVVYVAPKTEYTQFVILSSVMKLRGSDASWENDVEPPPRYLDYSDDEQEREARAQLRKKERPSDNNNEEAPKRTRTDDATHAEEAAQPQRRSGVRFEHNAGNFRTQYHSPRSYSGHGYRQQYNNAGSWHSAYRVGPPPRYRAPMVPAYAMHYNMYGMPPPPPPPPGPSNFGPHYAHPHPPPPPNPSMYSMHPYDIRPPVMPSQQTAPMYTMLQPPPPPPGGM